MEGQKRQKDDADDQNSKQDRPAHFLGGVKNDAEPAFLRSAGVLRKVPIGVFDHHKRSVGDLADGDRKPAQRHQVGRKPESLHGDERHERRDDQRDGHDSGASDMAQKEQEDEDHQHHALDQRITYRVNGGIHQLDAIIERDQFHACWEAMPLLEIPHLGLHRLDHLTGIASSNHEHRAGDHLPFPIEHHRTMADGVTDSDLRHIAHEDRRSMELLHDDRLDITDRPDETQPSDDRTLGISLEHIPAGIGVILRDSLVDFVQREVEFSQFGRIDKDLILLDEPAHPVHIDDSRHAFEQRPQHPVLDGPLVRQFPFEDLRIGYCGIRPCPELPVLSWLKS